MTPTSKRRLAGVSIPPKNGLRVFSFGLYRSRTKNIARTGGMRLGLSRFPMISRLSGLLECYIQQFRAAASQISQERHIFRWELLSTLRDSLATHSIAGAIIGWQDEARDNGKQEDAEKQRQKKQTWYRGANRYTREW